MSHQTVWLAMAQAQQEWENTLGLSRGATIASGSRDISVNWNAKVHCLPQNSSATSPCLESDESSSRLSTSPLKMPFKLSSHLRLGLVNCLNFSGFPHQTLYAFSFSPIQPIFSAHLIFLYFLAVLI